jgi:anti-sigma28 factor (negative regulator of flagellin synthesis)
MTMSDYAQLQEELDAAYDRIEDLESQIPPGTRTPHQQAAINRVKARREMEKQGEQARQQHRGKTPEQVRHEHREQQMREQHERDRDKK